MNVISRFLTKLSILLGRKRFGGELDEEMAFHRQQAESEFIAGGMTPEACALRSDAAVRQCDEVAGAKPRSGRDSRWRQLCRTSGLRCGNCARSPGSR